MSRKALSLPLRLSSRSLGQQWVCKRCLATQAETNNLPPLPTILDPSTPSSSSHSTTEPVQSGNTASRSNSIAFDPSGSQSRTDFYLSKRLPHAVPIQYLQHSTSHKLAGREKQVRETAVAHRDIVGVVVSTGKMDKTVKVRIPGQTWNKRIGKYFASHTSHLVHDPNNSLIAGDVVSLHRLRASSAVHHVVASIVTPFEKPIEDRPPIPTPDERLAAYKEHRFAKLQRRSLRIEAAKGNAEAIFELKKMGLDPGDGTAPGAGVQKQAGKNRESGKGAILGEKGQKLPKGVLPSGKHAVGKPDERAKRNKQSAMKLERKAEENLAEAEAKGEQLEQQGLGADSVFDGHGRSGKGH